MIRLRHQYEKTLIHEMRDSGYVQVLDIDPAFSVSYNSEHNNWFFMLTMHGVYVGKVKAWQIEGCSNGRMLPRSIQSDKLKKSSKQSLSRQQEKQETTSSAYAQFTEIETRQAFRYQKPQACSCALTHHAGLADHQLSQLKLLLKEMSLNLFDLYLNV